MLRLTACYVDPTAAQITLQVCSTQTSVPCPLCATPARRIHSRYERTLADLPWAAYRVRLQLRVRKWFCRHRACRRHIFTERLPTVTAPWARRTLRLAQRCIVLGVALGGKAGRAAQPRLGPPVSRHTLLRLLRQLPCPSPPRPGCWGWMISPCGNATPMAPSWWTWSAASPWRSCQSARPRPWRSGSGSTPGWRSSRATARSLCRGRTPGSPAATQVADRFHVLQNLAGNPHPGVHDAWPGARRRQRHRAPAARAPA